MKCPNCQSDLTVDGAVRREAVERGRYLVSGDDTEYSVEYTEHVVESCAACGQILEEISR